MMNLPRVEVGRYPSPKGLEFTVNTTAVGVGHLLQDNYRSHDEQPVDYWALFRRSAPDTFVSMAVRYNGERTTQTNQNLRGYGDIVVVVTWDAVADQTWIINGDVQNVSSAAGFGPICLAATTPRVELHEKLVEMAKRTCNGDTTGPRRHGAYFEGRCFRCIGLADIQAVFAPTDETADDLAKKFASYTEKRSGLPLTRP
jgi:hypothetical protein